ncbi:Sortase A, LPXTG specific [Lachnospiraceae bacterium TWA4]|nr:Sortase A, LPXTG specific [Lachnospiraceae bacterium TWA4]
MKKKRKFDKNIIINIMLVAIFLLGLSIMLYPTVSDWWNSMHQSRAVASYVEKVKDLSAEQREKMYKEAVAYNKKLSKQQTHYNLTEDELVEYNNTLDIIGTGIMGYIEIDKVGIKLPIYHGVDEAILQIAVGHIAGSALPVGGKSTHCVLSGHSGLPSARLFTDINKLVVGDKFVMTVLDHTLTYEVDQIRIVLPDELSDLRIEEGQDYCTLVTCTPYGVNTHRLLVRGHRVANDLVVDVSNVGADAIQIDPIMVIPIMVAVILVLIIVAAYILNRRKKKKK